MTRLERLTGQLDPDRYDGVVLNPGPSLKYLLGLSFHLMERPVLAFVSVDGGIGLALPELEVSRLDDVAFNMKVFPYGETPSSWGVAIRHAAESVGLASARLGIEPRLMRVLELDLIREALPDVVCKSAPELLDRLRMVKDASEVSLMREAVRVAEAGLADTVPYIRVGITERELANRLVENLLRNGADVSLPFAPIVAAGPNTADPHAEPTDRAIQDGDAVLIDWGAAHRGYFADLTRMFCVGTPSNLLADVARIVGVANAAGREAGRPGVTAADVDNATRGVIERAGFGERFTHRTGHGIGLEVHEMPYIRGDADDELEAGMTFTIEPGIYLPGQFGVRIEDDVVVTDSGLESLSTADRSLRILPIEAEN
jgi:Xaa-Pro dipeptidase